MLPGEDESTSLSSAHGSKTRCSNGLDSTVTVLTTVAAQLPLGSSLNPGHNTVLHHRDLVLHEGPLLWQVVCKGEGVVHHGVAQPADAFEDELDLARIEVRVLISMRGEVCSSS